MSTQAGFIFTNRHKRYLLKNIRLFLGYEICFTAAEIALNTSVYQSG